MAGYDGYSMSNNAREAYSNGEMPLSKWNKTLLIYGIMTSISENGFEYSDIDVDDIYKKIKKINCKKLKSVFLRYSSWHHTSCHLVLNG